MNERAAVRELRIGCIGLSLLGMLAATPAQAVDVSTADVTFTWSPSAGPVAGYGVFFSRNGSAFPATPDQLTASNEASFRLGAGETVSIRVAAHDANGTFGLLSEVSTPVRYVPATTGGGGGTNASGSTGTGGSSGNGSGTGSSTRGGAHALLWAPGANGSLVVTDEVTGAAGSLTLAPGWRIEIEGDFDGDGNSDLLVRGPSGATRILWMNGTTQVASLDLVTLPLSCGAAVAARFDGDAADDLLWRCNNGYNGMWLMSRAGIREYANLPPVDLSWAVRGAADVNRDGFSDLLWQNTGSGAGGYWLMNGFHLVGILGLPDNAGPTWKISGLGDLDGDGDIDLFWESLVSPDTAVWMMNRFDLGSARLVGTPPGKDFVLQEMKDVDGDGRADVVWRSLRPGTPHRAWLMNGSSLRQAMTLL